MTEPTFLELANEWEPISPPWEWIYEQTKLCQCGVYPEVIEDDLWEMFVQITKKEVKAYKIYSESKYNELLVHLLGVIDLVDHGFSIGSSRLTEKGERMWKLVTKNSWDIDYERRPFP